VQRLFNQAVFGGCNEVKPLPGALMQWLAWLYDMSGFLFADAGGVSEWVHLDQVFAC